MNGIIDTSKTYLFTSRFTGPNLVLAVTNRADNGSATTISMANATNTQSEGEWFLTRVNGNQPGIFYRVHAASLGVGQSLDVVNEGGAVNSTALKMAPSGDNSGQAWRFDRWSDKETDGYRLSNKLTGPDLHLDLTAATLDARLFGGDFSGQHWTLASASGATPPEHDVAQPGGSGSQRLLSNEGVVGLTVVAVLGLSLLVLGSLYLLIRSRLRRRNTNRRRIPTQKTFADEKGFGSLSEHGDKPTYFQISSQDPTFFGSIGSAQLK